MNCCNYTEPVRSGWMCPVCGCVYAPWVYRCDNCGRKNGGGCSYSSRTDTPDRPTKPLYEQIADGYLESLYSGTNEAQMSAPDEGSVDPNTQCVDCKYGKFTDGQDGTGKYIYCNLYFTFRNISDTCLKQTIDTSQMNSNEGGDIL